MPTEGPLKRLGSGRWETRDGRFAIEPQSGTWVVVDSSQTDDLGLPLVRGPFGSLTAAREAIEGVRSSAPARSPLADRLKEATGAPKSSKLATTDAAVGKRTGGKPAPSNREAATPAPQPGQPPEPKWLRDLAPAKRRQARDLIDRLEKVEGVDATALAREEVALDQPALAAFAIARRLRTIMATAGDVDAAVRAAAKAMAGGRDTELDLRWRLVDDRGRPIPEVDLSVE